MVIFVADKTWYCTKSCLAQSTEMMYNLKNEMNEIYIQIIGNIITKTLLS